MTSINSSARERIAIGSMFFTHGLCLSSWGARIPTIQAKLELGEAMLGTLLFSIPIGSILSMPLATTLVQRFGSKRVLPKAIFCYCLALALVGLAPTRLTLSAALILFGVLSNLVNVSVNTQALALESKMKKTIMSSLHGLWSLAGFTGAALGALMIAFQITPFYHFVFILVSALIIVSLNARHLTLEESIPPTGARWSLPNKALISLGAIAFCAMLSEGAMFDWSGVYFKKVIAASPEYVGLGYVSFMSTMAATRFFADSFIHRFGVKKTLYICGILICLGLLVSLVYVHLATGIIGFLLVGMGTSAVVPLTFSEAGRVKGAAPSYSIAAVSTIGFLGFLFGPPLIGWIAALFGLRTSFTLLTLLGAAIIFLARSHFKGR